MKSLTLYHNDLSTCSQKVRLILSAKGIQYKSQLLDLASGEQHNKDYVQLNPNHVVPTLIDDKHILCESSLINEYLEEKYPKIKTSPDSPREKHAMRLWVKYVDEMVSPFAAAITYGIGARPLLLNLPKENLENNINQIPNEHKRNERRNILKEGINSKEIYKSLKHFMLFLKKIEIEMPPGGWLSGDDFGLADAAAFPFILRLDHLSLDFLFSDTKMPRVNKWYSQFHELPFFKEAITDFLPLPLIEIFKANGKEEEKNVLKLINNFK